MIDHKSRSFFSQHFFTMLAASLFLLVFFVAVLLMPIHNTYNQLMVEANRNMIHKTTIYLDAILGQVNDTVDVVACDADVLNSTLIPRLTLYERNNGIVNKLSSAVQNLEYLASMVVYIPSHNLAFSSDHKIGPLESVTHPAVADALRADSSTRYQALHTPEGEKLYYIFRFPEEKHYGMGLVIAELRNEAFIAALSGQSSAVDDGYLLLDAQGQVLMSTSDVPSAALPEDYTRLIAAQETGYHLLSPGGVQRSFFHETSAATGWKCVYHMQTEQMISLNRTLLPIFVPTFLLFVVVSVLMTFFVTRHLYKPLEHLLGVVLDDQMSGAALYPASEYHLIGSRFMNLVQQRDHMRDILDNALALTKETFYHGALLGRELTESEWEFYNGNLNLAELQHKRYAVFILQINQPPLPAGDHYLEEQSRLIQFKQLIKQHCEPLENYVYNSFDHSMMVALLVLAGDASAQDAGVAPEIVHRIKDATQGSPSVTAGVSRPCLGADNIKTAYDEALEALRYKLYSHAAPADSDELAASAEPDEPADPSFEAHVDDIRRIVNAIRSGDEAQMENHLQTLCQALADAAPADGRHYAIYTLEKLLDSIAQMAITTGLNTQAIFGPQQKLYSDFGQLHSFEDHRDYITQVCRRAADEVRKEMTRKVHKYVQTAQNYVADHYKESGITLKSTAEYVGLNSAYLSKLFKNECGESYIDYLNNYRIEKAKELLSNTHASVKEVGYMVGFSSVQNFIRTFKKKEGVTPGRYGNSL